jgi:hypothetical protein
LIGSAASERKISPPHQGSKENLGFMHDTFQNAGEFQEKSSNMRSLCAIRNKQILPIPVEETFDLPEPTSTGAYNIHIIILLARFTTNLAWQR